MVLFEQALPVILIFFKLIFFLQILRDSLAKVAVLEEQLRMEQAKIAVSFSALVTYIETQKIFLGYPLLNA